MYHNFTHKYSIIYICNDFKFYYIFKSFIKILPNHIILEHIYKSIYKHNYNENLSIITIIISVIGLLILLLN